MEPSDYNQPSSPSPARPARSASTFLVPLKSVIASTNNGLNTSATSHPQSSTAVRTSTLPSIREDAAYPTRPPDFTRPRPGGGRPGQSSQTQSQNQSYSSTGTSSQAHSHAETASIGSSSSSARFNVRANSKQSGHSTPRHPVDARQTPDHTNTSQTPKPVQRDRQTFQLIQGLQATVVSQTQTIDEMRITINEIISAHNGLQETVTAYGVAQNAKDEVIHQLQSQLREQAESIADLEGEMYGGEGGTTGKATSKEKTAVGKFLKSALNELYGERPPVAYPDTANGESWPMLKAADGTETEPAMRWDFSKPLREEPNVTQTRRLYTYIQNKGASVPLPNDVPRSSIPEYSTHTNIYAKAVSDIFKNWRAAQTAHQLKEWGKTGRKATAKEIEELEQRSDALSAAEAERLSEKRAYLDQMDAASEHTMSEMKNNSRSRLVTVSCCLNPTSAQTHVPY